MPGGRIPPIAIYGPPKTRRTTSLTWKNHRPATFGANTMRDPLSQLRAIASARRYALADKSDPFTLNRALAHIHVGIVSPATVVDEKPRLEAIYDAKGTYDPKTGLVTYTSMVRP